MKKVILILLALMLTGSIISAFPADDFFNKKAASKSLIMGISSDNAGLQISSAYRLGEIQAKDAVIPLLKALHNESNENVRIAAALSLYKIGSYKGIYAVKMAAKYDKSERVRKFCEKFYNEYKLQK